MAGFSFRAFRLPSFATLFAGQFVAQTGLWFQTLSISFLVVTMTGSASSLAWISVATFGPTLICAPLATRAIVRWSAKSVVATACFATAAFAVGLGVVIGADDAASLGMIYALAAGSGAASVFTRIGAQALIYPVVGPHLLQNGVTLSSLYISGARSLGPGLAGFALAATGPVWCQVITAASHIAAGASLFWVRESFSIDRTGETRESGRGRSALPRPVRVVLLANIAITFFALNMAVVVTAMVTLSFEADADALGAAHALNAVGAVVGGVLVTRIVWVSARTVVPACLVLGASLLAAGLTGNLTLFFVVSPLLGIGLGVYQAVTTTAIQTETPPANMVRAISLLNMGTFGVIPLGSIAAGLAIDATSANLVLLIGAAACMICAAGVGYALRSARS